MNKLIMNKKDMLFFILLGIIIVCVIIYLSRKSNKQLAARPFADVWGDKNIRGETYRELVTKMMMKVIQILSTKNIEIIPIYGTLLGLVRHNGLIPWDDDIDFMINKKDIDVMLSLRKQFELNGIGISTKPIKNTTIMKFYPLSESPIDGYEYSWPFIDIFYYTEQDDTVVIEDNVKADGYTVKKSDIFPLVKRKFEGLDILSPAHPKHILNQLYPKGWDTECISSNHNHRKEENIVNIYSEKCSDVTNTRKELSGLFDNAWVINLQRRPDRMQKSINRLKEVGIDLNRWDATDANTPEFKKTWGALPEPKCSMGEVACYMSHLKLIQHLYDTGVENAMIFEDDYVFSNGVGKKDIEDAYLASNAYNIIFLGHCHANKGTFTTPIVKAGTALCLHAYIISRKGMKKLLDYKVDFSKPIDSITRSLCENELCYLTRHVGVGLPINSTTQGIVHQDEDLKSDLRETRSFAGVWTEACRLLERIK